MGYFLGPLGQISSRVMGYFLDPLGQFVFKSHGLLFWTPRKNFFGVMGLFFGPLGQFLMIS